MSGVGSRTLCLLGVAERFVTGRGCYGLLVALTSGTIGFWRRERGSLVFFSVSAASPAGAPVLSRYRPRLWNNRYSELV